MPISGSILPKACENCRIRKVRCNRLNPCSNCETSNITCRPAAPLSKRKSQGSHARRTRAAPTSPPPSRRSGPASSGQSPSLSIPQIRGPPTLGSPSTENLRVLAEVAERSPVTPVPFEGSSSFAEQAIHASRMAGVDIEDPGDPLTTSHPDSVRAAVASGNSLDHEYCFSERNKSVPEVDMELPPSSFVLRLLADLKKRPSKIFLAYCVHPISYGLDGMCQTAYFPLEPMSYGALATMYGLLYFLTLDYRLDADCPPSMQRECAVHGKSLERNFHMALENYSLLVTPTGDNLRALCLGIMKATKDNNPLLSWSLTSAAYRHVVALGYHREATLTKMTDADAEICRAVFWWVYVFDKSLSLRLGRTPNIQDYDIDVKAMKANEDPKIRPYDVANFHFIKLSRIQGLMYDRLYSLSAVRAHPDQRMSGVNEISSQLESWFEEWKELDTSNAIYPHFFQSCFTIIEPIYWATQALVHRASTSSAPTAEVTPKCYEAARRSIRSYLTAFESIESDIYGTIHTFVEEILFYTSLTPLIVIFLNAITTPNRDDVDLLLNAQKTLERLKTHSKETARIHRVCKIFSGVARSRLQASITAAEHGVPSDTTGVPATDIQRAIHLTNSVKDGDSSHDDFGSFSTPEDFDYNQMSAFVNGWLEFDRLPAEILNLDFVNQCS